MYSSCYFPEVNHFDRGLRTPHCRDGALSRFPPIRHGDGGGGGGVLLSCLPKLGHFDHGPRIPTIPRLGTIGCSTGQACRGGGTNLLLGIARVTLTTDPYNAVHGVSGFLPVRQERGGGGSYFVACLGKVISDYCTDGPSIPSIFNLQCRNGALSGFHRSGVKRAGGGRGELLRCVL